MLALTIPLWLGFSCADAPAANVMHTTPPVERPAFDEPTAFTSPPGAEGPWACTSELGIPLDGGFDRAVPADPDTPVVAGADPPVRVHLLLGEDGAHEVTVVWETTTTTVGGRVEVGVGSEALAWTIPGVSYLVGGVRVHVARLCGLTAASSWTFRAGSEAGWSEPGSFVTAPEAGVDEPVRFAVMGDSRDGEETFGALMAQMQAQGVDFVVFTGDAVVSGNSWSQWSSWFDASPAGFLTLPMVFVPGNHEFNDQYWFALFPSHTGVGHQNVDYGPVHLAAVNDTATTGNTMEAEALWLAADLAAATAPWPVAAWHKPAVSSCKPHGEDPETVEWFLPVAEAAPNVRLVVNGHNHNYERSVPLRGGVEESANGVVHLVSGGAGAPLYTSSYGQVYTVVESKTQHWVLFEADARTLHGTAFDIAGNVLDDFVIER